MKSEIRILGIDDGPFDKFKDKKILVVGVVLRGNSSLVGILSTKVDVDGWNSTSKLIKMINKCKFKLQLRCIMLDGIAFGGFNVIDIDALYRKIKIPVMVVIRRKPNFRKIEKTLKKIGMKEKFNLMKKAGKVRKIGKIYVQLKGIDVKKAEGILGIACKNSYLPEAVRMAHIIAAGIVKGESKGRA